jgi:hypothetical protein
MPVPNDKATGDPITADLWNEMADVVNAKAEADDLSAHLADVANPHAVTKSQVGLANADNTSDANKPVSTATQTALDAKASSASLAAHTGNTSNPHSVTKSQVGLGNAENTSDANKPISTATQTALDGKAATNQAITSFAVGTLADGQFLKRSGGSLVGDTPGGSGDMTKAEYDPQNIEDDAFALGTHTGDLAQSRITGLVSALAGKAAASDLTDHISDATAAHAATAISNTPAGTIAATTVQAAINELDGDVTAHVSDSSAAHAASAIGFTPAGSVAATDVQAAIVEVDGDVTAHVGDSSAAHAASAISFSATGNIAATDVQAAIAELDTEKSSTSHNHDSTYAAKFLSINGQSGTTYTLVLTDADGKIVECDNAGAIALTIPPNSDVAFQVGTVIPVYQKGAGQVTVAAGAGVTLRAPGGAKTRVQYSEISLRKRATDEWVLAGDSAS